MNQDKATISKLFLSESNRNKEQSFLRSITDNYKNLLKFTQNTCTDGNIVEVYPTHPVIFNEDNLKSVAGNLKMDVVSENFFLAMKFFSRGGITHEAFHILFTDFQILKDMAIDFKSKSPFHRKKMHEILNIGEDGFIELAGINFLPGLESYITFSNELIFGTMKSLEEIEERVDGNISSELDLYLHWAMMHTIIGKFKGTVKNSHVLEKIEKTKDYFSEMRINPDARKRYELAKKIYAEIEDLIKASEKKSNSFVYPKNANISHGEGTPQKVEIKKDFKNRNDAQPGESGEGEEGKGQDSSEKDSEDKDPKDGQDSSSGKSTSGNTEKTDEEKKSESSDEDLKDLIEKLKQEELDVKKEEKDKEKEEKKEQKKISRENMELSKVKYSDIHRGISLKIERLKAIPVNEYERNAYNKVKNEYKPIIRAFIKQFKAILEARSQGDICKLKIGTKLDTRRLADPKRRNWQKPVENKNPADLNIVIVIDGSGSMMNNRNSVIAAVIVIYEVAIALGIPICIIEESAIYYQDLVQHRILVDYNNYKNPDARYNILRFNPDEGTREGVSLKWCSNYQKLQGNKDNLMIVIADGDPQHTGTNSDYGGKIALSDTHQVAKEIEKGGTQLTAISLGEYCFEALDLIYSHTILCDNLDKLPKQLINILKKKMFK